jgi:glycosyl transferase family 25
VLPQDARVRLWKMREGVLRTHLRRRYIRIPVAAVVLRLRSLLQRRDRGPRGVARLSGIVVLNLDRQPDRLSSVTAELRRIGIRFSVRFPAIADTSGIRGCTLSHAAIMRLMIDNDWASMMVCEDDVRFDLTREQLDVLVDEFLADSRAEVACLAYWHRLVQRHSLLYLRATKSFTTACYLVKRSIAKDLADVWHEGARHLANGEDRHVYGVDQAWAHLQKTRTFLIPIIRAAHQNAGYSDIWEREVRPDY